MTDKVIITKNEREIFVNINSAFREYVKGVQQPVNNFITTLPAPIKNVTSLRLNTFQSPDTEYTLTTNNNQFYIILNNISYMIEVKPGRYSEPADLVSVVQSAINSYANLYGVVFFNHNDDLRKFDFSGQDPSQIPTFELNFDGEENKNKYIDQTFGWEVGFRKSYYSNKPEYLTALGEKCKTNVENIGGITFNKYENSNTYLGEMVVILPNLSKYYLLSVEDYQQSSDYVYIEGVFPIKNLNDTAIIEKVPTRYAKLVSSTISNTWEVSLPRVYGNPVTLSRFRIRLYDDKNQLVDLNNDDYSFTLKLTIQL